MTLPMLDPKLDLEISRVIAAPRKRVWQAWSDPKILAEWWCPKPWKTEVKAFDFRPGGAFHTYMTGPDGKGGTGESDNPGCFLDIVPLERIVGTSALGGSWRPITSWMPATMIFSLSDEANGTRYSVRVMHRETADMERHKEMGFYDGFGTCITQLEEVARSIS